MVQVVHWRALLQVVWLWEIPLKLQCNMQKHGYLVYSKMRNRLW